jgi:hypothetical protein
MTTYEQVRTKDDGEQRSALLTIARKIDELVAPAVESQTSG